MNLERMKQGALVLVGVVLMSMTASLAQTAAVPIQTGTGHRFAVTDYSGNKVLIISPEGKVEWEYPTGSTDDVWVLPGGNILFNTGRGVLEVSPDKKVVWTYESKTEVYACQRLENGNTLVGECNLGRILEVDKSGKVVFTLNLLPEGTDGGHAYMRNARKLKNGNYMVCLYNEEVVREYDPAGKIVASLPAPSGPHSAARLENGNTLIACGDKRKTAQLLEVDQTGKVVWQIGTEELPGISLKFLTGFHRLPNGNTVISNWLGHGEFGKAPHIIEVTPDKKVVWTYQDFTTLKTASSVQVLDVPVGLDIVH